MRNAKTYVPQLLCPQPTKESDQTAFFLRNALTLVPRNNLARYSWCLDPSGGQEYGLGNLR